MIPPLRRAALRPGDARRVLAPLTRRWVRPRPGGRTDGRTPYAMKLNGARRRIRTTDTRIFNPLLYQLSYPGADRLVPCGGAFLDKLPRAVQRQNVIAVPP